MPTTTAISVNQTDQGVSLDIDLVGGNVGAEVRGVALCDPLGEATVRSIRVALARHKVLFFRRQHGFDEAMLERFASELGEPYTHPTVKGTGRASVTALEAAEGYAASGWHTDVTFAPSYPRFTLLHGITMPAAGGDTLFANTATAYEQLPESFKAFADGLWAYHDNRFDYARNGEVRVLTGYTKAFFSRIFQTEHPLVHVHPDSGERNLLGGSYLKRIRGYEASDSDHLRAIIQDHVTRPENTVRWRWQADDVVVWDNAATQHQAIADFGTQRRSLRRATAGNFTPVSVDGLASRIVNEIEN